jgi:hypothetical protein
MVAHAALTRIIQADDPLTASLARILGHEEKIFGQLARILGAAEGISGQLSPMTRSALGSLARGACRTVHDIAAGVSETSSAQAQLFEQKTTDMLQPFIMHAGQLVSVSNGQP